MKIVSELHKAQNLKKFFESTASSGKAWLDWCD